VFSWTWLTANCVGVWHPACWGLAECQAQSRIGLASAGLSVPGFGTPPPSPIVTGFG